MPRQILIPKDGPSNDLTSHFTKKPNINHQNKTLNFPSTPAHLCQCLCFPLSFLLKTNPALSSIPLSLLTSSQPLVFLTLSKSKLEINKTFQDLTSYSLLFVGIAYIVFHFLKALQSGSHPGPLLKNSVY